MEQVDFFSAWQVTVKSNGPDKKERTKRNENVGMQKSANFTIVSTTLMIGLNIYKTPGFLLTNFLTTKFLLSLSNTEILCEEHVKL